MNLLKSLFGQKVQNIINQGTDTEGLSTIYFSKDKKLFHKIKLTQDTTLEEILNMNEMKIKLQNMFEKENLDQNLASENQNPIPRKEGVLTKDYIMTICDLTNHFTEINLNPRQKPLKYMKNPNYYMVLKPRQDKVEDKTKKMRYLNNIKPSKLRLEECNQLAIKEMENKSKKKEKNESLLTGYLLKYSLKEKKFKKKKFSLNEFELINLNSKKRTSVKIDNITKISYKIDSSKYFLSSFEDKNFMFEIITNTTLHYLFKCRSQNEFDWWKNGLEGFIQKRDDKIRNIEYNKKINYLLFSFEPNYLNQISDDIHLYVILNKRFIRAAFFSLFEDRRFTDIMESILAYKSTINTGDTLNSLPGFKEIIGQLRVTTFKSEPEADRNKYLMVTTNEKIEQLLKCKEDSDSLFIKFTNIEDLNSEMAKILTKDLFDDLFTNILKNIIIPFYEKEFKNSFDFIINEIAHNTFSSLYMDVKKKIGDSNSEELFDDFLDVKVSCKVGEDNIYDKKVEKNYEIIRRMQMILAKECIDLYQYKSTDFLNIVKKK